MKLRHVRVVAVTAAVLVALTGARKSDGDGGGCSNDNAGSSASAATSGGSGGSGGSGRKGAMRDITIESCGVDAAGKLVVRLRISNPKNSFATTYSATVRSRTSEGQTLGSARLEKFEVPAGQTVTTEISGAATVPDAQGGSGRPDCSVTRAAKY